MLCWIDFNQLGKAYADEIRLEFENLDHVELRYASGCNRKLDCLLLKVLDVRTGHLG